MTGMKVDTRCEIETHRNVATPEGWYLHEVTMGGRGMGGRTIGLIHVHHAADAFFWYSSTVNPLRRAEGSLHRALAAILREEGHSPGPYMRWYKDYENVMAVFEFGTEPNATPPRRKHYTKPEARFRILRQAAARTVVAVFPSQRRFMEGDAGAGPRQVPLLSEAGLRACAESIWRQ